MALFGSGGNVFRALAALTLALVALGAASTATAVPLPAPAEQEDARLAVLLAALPAVRPLLPEGHAVLDAEPLCEARLMTWDCPDEVLEAAEEHDLEPGSREFTYVCLEGKDRQCHLFGTRALVSLGEPRIRRRTAQVDAELVWLSGEAGASPTVRRHRIHLVRQRPGWRVVRVVQLP